MQQSRHGSRAHLKDNGGYLHRRNQTALRKLRHFQDRSFRKKTDVPTALRFSDDSRCSEDRQKTSPTLSIDDFSKAPANTEETLSKIGYHLGKWIYLIDAIDDIEENISSGTYNPLIYRFNYDEQIETPVEFRKRTEAPLKFNLYHYLASLSNYVNSLDIRKNQGIIENIIYFGLNKKTEEF